MRKSVLVFGASGAVGAPLVRELIGRGLHVQVASRAGKTMESAKPVKFDFGIATDIQTLLQGVDNIFLLVPSGLPDTVRTLSPIIQAASVHKIKVVYLSAFGAGEHEDHENSKVEQVMKSSGVVHVSLRPNWFSDNFHTFWKSDVLQGKLRLPAAYGKTSFIDVRDIAMCAAVALTRDEFNGRTIELTGPEALDYGQAAEVLSAATGKNITYTPLSEDDYIQVHTAEGMPSDFAKTIARFFAPVRAGQFAPVTEGVFELTGLRPRTLAEYARDNASHLGSCQQAGEAL